MNKFIIVLFLIAYIFCQNSYSSSSLDYGTTEPYVEFDWLDDDKKSLTLNFQSSVSPVAETCCLYNGTILCKTSCSLSNKQMTCEFEGNNCKADGDNPATKYYHYLLCGTACDSDSNAATASGSSSTLNPQVTVAVMSGNYIKYSMILLLSLLVL